MRNRLLMAILATLIFAIQVDATEKTLRIVNNRDAFPIWNVYITPAGQSDWGKDQLGGTTIGVGQSHEWTIPWDGCLVDVKATTFTGLSAEKRGVNVCGGFTWTLYDADTKRVKSSGKTLRVVNNREAFPIWNVYITPAGQTNWGKDQLGGATIGVGQSHEWTIPWDGCLVDVKATTFTGLSAETRGVNVCGGFTWTLYDTDTKRVTSSGKTLRVVNNREAFPIWNVYITPAGQTNWGKDQLGGTTIGVGQSHEWTIPWDGCLVDVKATTFTGLSAEKRGVNVCGGFTWTLYDKE